MLLLNFSNRTLLLSNWKGVTACKMSTFISLLICLFVRWLHFKLLSSTCVVGAIRKLVGLEQIGRYKSTTKAEVILHYKISVKTTSALIGQKTYRLLHWNIEPIVIAGQSDKPPFPSVDRCNNLLGMLGVHSKSCKSLAGFINFSHVLPTSQVGYYAGKPMKSAVYCLLSFTSARYQTTWTFTIKVNNRLRLRHSALLTEN